MTNAAGSTTHVSPRRAELCERIARTVDMNLGRDVADHELGEMVVALPIVAREFYRGEADVEGYTIVAVQLRSTIRLQPRGEQAARGQWAHPATRAMTIERIQHGDGVGSVGGLE